MLNSLLNSLSSSTEKLAWPNYDIYNKRLNKNVDNLTTFKSTRDTWVNSTFPLISFINLLPKSFGRMDYESLDRIYNEGLPLANRVGTATTFNKADPLDMGFFNNRCKEQWIAVMESRNPVLGNPKPVRCLWHPFTSMNFWIEESVNIFSQEVSFFIIDIIALSKMVNSEYKKEESFDARNFIAKKIIPTLISDVVNITLFNRLRSLFLSDNLVDEYSRSIPIWFDLIEETNKEQKEIIDTLSRSPGGIDFISQNIPLNNINLYDFLGSLPDTPSTKNIFPLIFTVFSIYINFILAFNNSINGVKNRTFLSSLKIQLNIMKNDRTLYSDDSMLYNQQMYNFELLKALIR